MDGAAVFLVHEIVASDISPFEKFVDLSARCHLHGVTRTRAAGFAVHEAPNQNSPMDWTRRIAQACDYNADHLFVHAIHPVICPG